MKIPVNLSDINIKYYDNNAKEFYDKSVKADMKCIQDRFLSYLPKNSEILDFGCGSGRDMKVFLDKGHKVDGIDGSRELAKLASANTGRKIEVISFQSFEAKKEYDGIWACASLLHFPAAGATKYLNKLIDALKTGGILYFSLKKGTGEEMQRGRYFKFYSEQEIYNLLDSLSSVKLVDLWESEDSRLSEENVWFNILLKKNG